METARDRIGRYPIEERGGRCPVSPPFESFATARAIFVVERLFGKSE